MIKIVFYLTEQWDYIWRLWTVPRKKSNATVRVSGLRVASETVNLSMEGDNLPGRGNVPGWICTREELTRGEITGGGGGIYQGGNAWGRGKCPRIDYWIFLDFFYYTEFPVFKSHIV